MGYAKKRIGKDSKPRYTAVYVDLRGSERSAGTFASQKAADRAWQKAEVELLVDRTAGSQATEVNEKQIYCEVEAVPSATRR